MSRIVLGKDFRVCLSCLMVGRLRWLVGLFSISRLILWVCSSVRVVWVCLFGESV